MVLAPDHLHTIWTLQPDDADYSRCWGWIKKEFTKEWLLLGGVEQAVTVGRRRERRRGIWQPRFWEHTIRDANDFERHFDYIHYNPVKHRLARCPHGWPWSSFHRWVRAGVYTDDWACSCRRAAAPLDFQDIEDATDTPVLAVLPYDIRVLEALSQSIPSTVYNERSKATIEYKKLAAALIGEEYEDGGFVSK